MPAHCAPYDACRPQGRPEVAVRLGVAPEVGPTVEGASRALVATVGAVATSGGGRTECDEPVDLAGYDRASGLLEGGCRSRLGSRSPSARLSLRGRAPCSYRGGRPMPSSVRRPRASRGYARARAGAPRVVEARETPHWARFPAPKSPGDSGWS